MPFCFNATCYFLIYVLHFSVQCFFCCFSAMYFFFFWQYFLFIPTFSGTHLCHKTMPRYIHFCLTIFFSWFTCRKLKYIALLLYYFFWVIPQHLSFKCRCFGTLCLFHLHRRVGVCRMNWVGNVGVYTGRGLARIAWAIRKEGDGVGADQIQTRLWRVMAHKGHRLVCEGDRGEVWGGGSQTIVF
jgi:hypothetical protein